MCTKVFYVVLCFPIEWLLTYGAEAYFYPRLKPVGMITPATLAPMPMVAAQTCRDILPSGEMMYFVSLKFREGGIA